MAKETFVPQEYCATCWYVEAGDMYPILYRDRQGSGDKGEYDSGDEVFTTASVRIPEAGSFKDVALPTNIVGRFDNKTNVFYTAYTTEQYIYHGRTYTSYPYTGGQVSPVYRFTYNGSTYYFKNYHSSENAS